MSTSLLDRIRETNRMRERQHSFGLGPIAGSILRHAGDMETTTYATIMANLGLAYFVVRYEQDPVYATSNEASVGLQRQGRWRSVTFRW